MNNKNLHSIALASAVLILFFTITLSATTAQSASPTITETRITNTGSASSPDIFGDKIVWVDNKNGSYDIYMYDISASRETQITTNKSNQMSPSIYGDKIFWMDDRSGNWDIYMYDIPTSKETRVTASGSANAPDVYGNKVVWQNNSNIYMYDLSTSQKIQISTSGKANNPAIHGNRIVWEDTRRGNSQIYMYDILTGRETQITTAAGNYYRPSIYGDRIAYETVVYGGNYIQVYDLSTSNGQIIAAQSASGRVGNSAIYGDRVVYGNISGSYIYKADIYMYDLSTSQQTQISTLGRASIPKIYGNRVVWMDNSANLDIYLSTISGDEQEPIYPAANFSTNVTSGYVPLSVQFTDLSENSTSRNWDFENDGNVDSTEETPVYMYSNPGTYTVNLTAKNENGTSSKTATINVLPALLKIPIITWNPPADITAGIVLGSEQLNAKATDPNTGSSVTGTFTYNPEEGTVLSVGAHTLHTDFTPSDSATYNNSSADVQVNVLAAPLKTPLITWSNPADITAGTALSDTQLNAVAKDPVSEATIDGTFTYKPPIGTTLSVGNGQTLHVDFVPTDTATYNNASKDMQINVLEQPVAPIASFSASPTIGKAPLIVTFTDSSTGSPTSWSWNFGDRSSSTDQYPSHTYSKAGKYTVILKVENAVGSNTKTIPRYITVESNLKKK